MENIQNKIICDCGETTVLEAVNIFKETDLPYKKAKKLVTKCKKHVVEDRLWACLI